MINTAHHDSSFLKETLEIGHICSAIAASSMQYVQTQTILQSVFCPQREECLVLLAMSAWIPIASKRANWSFEFACKALKMGLKL
jgi:hypothetical protein